MKCIEQNRDVIKAIAALDISATAKLVGQVMLLAGASTAAEIMELTGLTKSTAYRCMHEFMTAGGLDLAPIPELPICPIVPTGGNPTLPKVPTLPAGGNFDQDLVPLVGISGLAPTCADIASHANKESSTKILLVKEEASKLAAPDLSEEMISNIAKWANMPEANSAQWLASTIATFGQTATVESYHKMMSDKLQGAVVAKPISTWSKIAKRMKDEAEAVVKTGSERIAPWKQEKIDGTREALKIAAEMGYA